MAGYQKWVGTVKHSRISASRLDEDSLASQADDIRERLSSALRLVDQVASVPASRLPNQPVTEKEIRALLRLRRARDQFFDGELFADPAWDILLELYAARLGQQRISVGSLCQGAAVPATTALRWISHLEAKGLIERKPDRMDGRRFYLTLSAIGLDSMASYFRTVPVGASLV